MFVKIIKEPEEDITSRFVGAYVCFTHYEFVSHQVITTSGLVPERYWSVVLHTQYEDGTIK